MLFERLVETTLGVTKEEMSQPVFAGLGCLNYPELHDVRTSRLPSLWLLLLLSAMDGSAAEYKWVLGGALPRFPPLGALI